MCNPTTELRDVCIKQHCNLPGAVVLVLEKLRGQRKKERKVNFRAFLTGNCPVDHTMTDHSPWRTGFNLRRVNVRIVVGNVRMGYAFGRALFILLNIIPSVLNAYPYIPEVTLF